MASLYELTGNYRNIQELLGDPEIPEEAIHAALEEVGGSIAEKAEAYAKVRLNLLAEVDMLDAEINRLTKMKTTRSNNISRLMGNINDAMISVGAEEIKTNLGTFKFDKHPPAVTIVDASLIPEEYWVQAKPTISKDAIKKTLTSGQKVAGAALTQGVSLKFK